MSKSILKNEGSKVEIGDDEIVEGLEVILLSGNLRSGVGKPENRLAQALYTKLDHSSVLGMEDFLQEAKDEVKEALVPRFRECEGLAGRSFVLLENR